MVFTSVEHFISRAPNEYVRARARVLGFRGKCGGVNRLWALGVLCTSTLCRRGGGGGGVNRLWAPPPWRSGTRDELLHEFF